MGFDISYHPISPEQMNDWYFNHLHEAANGDFSQIEYIGQQNGIDRFYIDKYIDTMKVAAATGEHENFEKTHSYYMAVIQGFFHTYYYTRGTAYSFLIQEKPQMKTYITSWNSLKPSSISCPVSDGLTENYSGGVYLGAAQVVKLLEDYENNGEIHDIVTDFFEQNLPVFIKALKDAAEHQMGLLEATEVVEPQPIDLSQTTSFSNLMNCDKEGAFIFQQVAMEQVNAFAEQEQLPAGDILEKAEYRKTIVVPESTEPAPESIEPAPKQSIWNKLFKKK